MTEAGTKNYGSFTRPHNADGSKKDGQNDQLVGLVYLMWVWEVLRHWQYTLSPSVTSGNTDGIILQPLFPFQQYPGDWKWTIFRIFCGRWCQCVCVCHRSPDRFLLYPSVVTINVTSLRVFNHQTLLKNLSLILRIASVKRDGKLCSQLVKSNKSGRNAGQWLSNWCPNCLSGKVQLLPETPNQG